MQPHSEPTALVISNKSRWLLLILLFALIMRLVFVLSQDHLTPYNKSWWYPDHGLARMLPQNPLVPYHLSAGDTWWYLDHGLALFDGTVKGPPPSAPLYLLFSGIWQTLFPGAGAVIALRISQAVMATITCFFAYRLALALTGDERAGLIAALALAIAPVFIIESAQILTETLYIFLLMAGLTAYVEMVGYSNQTSHRYVRIVLVALLLGLATMTRAVLLLFPLGLAFHLLLLYGWRRGLKYAFLLLTVYSLLTSIWSIYNLVRWDTRVVGAQGLSAFFFIGATEWKDPDQIDASLAQGAGGQLPSNVGQQQEIYADAAAQAIGADPVGWITKRFSKLAGAFLQPHGTTFFPGESLKDAALDWLKRDRTPSGLLRLTQGDQFWPKLAIYLFYYTSLFGGLLGLWITRRKWRVALPLTGFILYTLLLHLLLDALPRYLFPLNALWWVFAAVAIVAVWDRIRHPRRLPAPLAHQA